MNGQLKQNVTQVFTKCCRQANSSAYVEGLMDHLLQISMIKVDQNLGYYNS
jgi:hypothetical protein